MYKVYCSECEYIRNDEWCRIEDKLAGCSLKNKHNNCKDFKPMTWYKKLDSVWE